MNPAFKWGLLGVLAAVAGAYFGFLAWKARPMARVLLTRGSWKARGWSESGLALLLRALGIAGVLVALAAISLVVVRLRG
jgi:hypothetical protein